MLCNKKTKRNLAILLIAATVLGVTVAAWATHKEGHNPGGGKPGGEDPVSAGYTIFDLGSFGSGGSYARSINESGQVAGFSFGPDGGRAFLVTPEYDNDGNPVVWFRDDEPDGINDLMMDIGTLGDDSSSRAYGVNDSGQVVGYSYGEVDGTDRKHAFLWDSISGMIDLGTVGLDHSSALDISNSGYVVGFVSKYSSSNEGHAFIVVPEDTDGSLVWFRDQDADGDNALMIDLGVFAGDSVSRAWAVNDCGQVVGQSFGEFGSDLWGRGFLITPEEYDSDGNPIAWFRDDEQGGNALMIELSPLSGHEGSTASAINSSGQVVGSSWSIAKNQSSNYHAVRWDVDELGNVTVTDLGKATAATSINDVGQVIGSANSWRGNKVSRIAFFWENGNMTKLIDLIANSEGIGDLGALGINEYGEIVGTIYGDGYHHAYIAIPIISVP